MEREFRYNAFISYRHTEPDRFVAENLYKRLENFRLPHSVAKKRKNKPNKIERVFRDKEELPLTSNLEDPIVQALQSSEWLIVICTPRLPQSLWCKKEIETFIKLRGREHVLAVLAEGEPAESFPEELLYKLEERTLPDGSVEQVKIPVEPLAADMRGKDKKAILKAMKTEILRLLAAMFEMPYDDLRQRHREHKMRRILTATALGGAACLLFGIYSTATAIRIQRQKEQIEAQSAEIQEQSAAIKAQSEAILLQSEEIAKQNTELSHRQAYSLAALAENYLADGNRMDAVNTAVEALTESDGIALPYTPQAQMILTESVRAYDTGNSYKAEYQFETAGRVEDIIQSPDGDTLLIADDTGSLTLFDLESREVIKTLASIEITNAYTFLGEKYFVYEKNIPLTETDKKLIVFDLEEKKDAEEIEISDYLLSLQADAAGRYLVGETWENEFVVLDGNTFTYLGATAEIEGSVYADDIYISEEGILAYVAADSTAGLWEQEYTLCFWDLDTRELFSGVFLGNKEVIDLKFRDGVAYVAFAEYADAYMNCDSYVSAIDVKSGRQLWEQKFTGSWADGIQLSGKADAKNFLFMAGSNVVFMNSDNGEILQNLSISSDVAAIKSYADGSGYMLIAEDGVMQVVTNGYGSVIDMSRYLECATTSNDKILWTSHGVVVLERNARKVTVYTIKQGADVVQIDKELAFPEQEDIMFSEAIEIAASYQIEKPDYVNNLYYSDDKKYCFIFYWDNTMVVYDVENGKVLNTIEDCYSTEFYIGEDAQGCTYLLGYHGCYVLNRDMEPIMWIPNAKEVDIEKQKVYLEWNSNYCFEAPIYTLEQLILLGQNYKN